MSVDRPQIFKAQFFKNGAGYHQVLNAAFDTFDSIQNIGAEVKAFQPAFHVVFDFIIGFARTQVTQILRHGTYVF